MNKMNATIGSAALTAAFVLMPFAASAATVNASSSTGVIISPNGIVRVVAATKIRDMTTILPFKHVMGGKISSVNSANGSFVITKGDRSVTVQTNASTTIMVNGTATTTLASVLAGDEVKVSGTPNADGSVITATNVVVREHDVTKPE